MSTVEVLKAAKALIEDPGRWTQEAWARSADGRGIVPNDPAATKWCADGAVLKCSKGLDETTRWSVFVAVRRAAFQEFGISPMATNDGLGHAAVLQMYDKAIELAEAQG